MAGLLVGKKVSNIFVKSVEDHLSSINTSTCRIVVAYKTFGPYHIARLAHLAGQARSLGICLEGLALAGRQQDYPWLEIEGEGLGFRSTTLFPGEVLENISSIRLFKESRRYLRKTRPTVIFASNYASVPMALLAIGARLQGGKAVIMSDSTWLDVPRNAIKERIKRLALTPYDAAFVSGERANSYMQHLGVLPGRIVSGCDVVDNQTVSRYVLAAQAENEISRRDLLCVARLIPEKNLFRLIDAYALYRREHASVRPLSLRICGAGPLERDLRSHANRCGAPDIAFAGFIPQPALYSWFANARALILPSVSETWGLVINEALAAGLPVLVSNRCGCVPEFIRTGETGWSFEPENVPGLASLMARVEKLSDKELDRMGAVSKKVVAEWDLPRFSNGVLDLTKMLNTI